MIYYFKRLIGGWIPVIGMAAGGIIVGFLLSGVRGMPIGIIGGFLTSMIMLGVLWLLTWATGLDAKRYVRKHYPSLRSE